MDMYKSGQSGFMWEHCAQSHGGVRGPEGGREDYKMSVLVVDRQALRRILREAIRIRRAEDGLVVEELEDPGGGPARKAKVTLMNDKREWYLPRIVTVRVGEL